MLSGFTMLRNIRKVLRCSMEILCQNWSVTNLRETSRGSSSSSSWFYLCLKMTSLINCRSSSLRQLDLLYVRSLHKSNHLMTIMDVCWSWPRSCQDILLANRPSTNRSKDSRWQRQRWRSYRRSCKRRGGGKDAKCRSEVRWCHQLQEIEWTHWWVPLRCSDFHPVIT